MIDHTGIGVTDVARAAVFYDAALGALGLHWVMQLPPRTTALMGSAMVWNTQSSGSIVFTHIVLSSKRHLLRGVARRSMLSTRRPLRPVESMYTIRTVTT
jgi:catechol 2,3-dioxygenase-like lactoylglutathione lyase family enzyme